MSDGGICNGLSDPQKMAELAVTEDRGEIIVVTCRFIVSAIMLAINSPTNDLDFGEKHVVATTDAFAETFGGFTVPRDAGGRLQIGSATRSATASKGRSL